jgi:hypothetical protein
MELPTPKDFSRESIKKTVVKEALTHPATMYPGVIATLFGLAGLLFASPVLLVAAGGMAVAGASSIVVNYCFRYESVGRQYIEALSTRVLQQKENLVNSLVPDLEKCKQLGQGIFSQQCLTGLYQFNQAKTNYDEVKEILQKKLRGGELLYGRFMGTVEQVYLGVLDNLREIVNTIETMPDVAGSREQLETVINLASSEPAKRQIQAMLSRHDLRDAQMQKVESLLATNEEAITELERTIIAATSMKSDSRLSEVSHEEAIDQLKQVAERVYSMNQPNQSKNDLTL